ncbi:MAG: UDP-N-acetylglucosamine pyrophosphorylase / Glucosamine-1-phosphate N-acetyltransferase [Chloroflexi bacterium AL-W]|nr:UDP-N-acetylglucosamine pyrophosphorylase / Glucosamine-1-phosphate N-acetyltransferase [Chloroflexi bacterium AL-N1]NOK70283.1 UDP-N-acetylglucosamine pyrophosphorylase / Glucosamine-1-phosphate N-acetyltransferase [Chloroflexi bacterium AL-N10]NOK77820.1 UDP-N-acetylglucosamine pyrophosphorylase / Glucosamine-1-phosphate N-acetyltransferase [Chloroflexi bacterium AL-N5]NOK84829.1 UDP-N-acetylglucosamine pyrophosphorylase / Glucosamine-1-phosphate N-acetyltransferase [Chloroflexi bacterium A
MDYARTTLAIVVLAAGDGTRMRSSTPKVLHTLCGRSLLQHVLAVADELTPRKTVVVLAPHTIEEVRFQVGTRFICVVQSERLGTGHAVLQARADLQDQSTYVLVLYGDTPLLRAETAQSLLALQVEQQALVGFISFIADPPTGYGRVVRNAADQVVDLIEDRNATAEQQMITEVNSGVMCFRADWLWERVLQIAPNPIKGEYYLTDLVKMAVAEQGLGSVVAFRVEDRREAWGINDRVQLAQAEAVMRERILTSLMREGVTIVDPATTYVDVDVVVGNDTTLLPGTMLRGSSQIGHRCVIGPYTSIKDAVIGNGTQISYASIEKQQIGNEQRIGPFAQLGGEEMLES